MSSVYKEKSDTAEGTAFESFELSVEFISRGPYDEEYRQPYDQIRRRKYGREDAYHRRLEWDPRVYQIASDVRYIDGKKMAEKGLCHGPFVYLVEYAGACLQESQNIGGKDGYKHLTASERKAVYA